LALSGAEKADLRRLRPRLRQGLQGGHAALALIGRSVKKASRARGFGVS
jgi:hypothetical protein